MKRATDAIARMMTCNHSIVEDVGFRSLLNVAESAYKILLHTMFSKEKISNMYDEYI